MRLCKGRIFGKYNCLFYEQGNIEEAVEKLEILSNDKELQKNLIKNGIKTVEKRYWKNIEDQILDLYL